MWDVCQKSLRRCNIKTNELSFVYLTNIHWVVPEVPGTRNTGRARPGPVLFTFRHQVKDEKQKRRRGTRKTFRSWLKTKSLNKSWGWGEGTVQLYVSWVKNGQNTFLLVSRGFPDGRSISIRGLPATEWMIFLIALFSFFFFFPPNFTMRWWGNFQR